MGLEAAQTERISAFRLLRESIGLVLMDIGLALRLSLYCWLLSMAAGVVLVLVIALLAGSGLMSTHALGRVSMIAVAAVLLLSIAISPVLTAWHRHVILGDADHGNGRRLGWDGRETRYAAFMALIYAVMIASGFGWPVALEAVWPVDTFSGYTWRGVTATVIAAVTCGLAVVVVAFKLCSAAVMRQANTPGPRLGWRHLPGTALLGTIVFLLIFLLAPEITNARGEAPNILAVSLRNIAVVFLWLVWIGAISRAYVLAGINARVA